MAIKKGYNNDDSWTKLETDNLSTKIINIDKSVLDDDAVNDEIVDTEDIDDDIINEELDNNFSDVLELTQYEDKSLAPATGNYSIAEYNDIAIVEIDKKHKLAAKNFVSKITKFILDFNDVQLTEDHKKYIKQVGTLQLQHLSDTLYLVDINKLMINNIIARVNATQAEDYSIINSYNNLVNQHLKLIKELQNTYRSIPTVLKKMRADVMCDQNLQEDINNEMITEEYGNTQFNNSKHFLRSLLDKREKNKNQNLSQTS